MLVIVKQFNLLAGTEVAAPPHICQIDIDAFPVGPLANESSPVSAPFGILANLARAKRCEAKISRKSKAAWFWAPPRSPFFCPPFFCLPVFPCPTPKQGQKDVRQKYQGRAGSLVLGRLPAPHFLARHFFAFLSLHVKLGSHV
jgi:hypothetical protein